MCNLEVSFELFRVEVGVVGGSLLSMVQYELPVLTPTRDLEKGEELCLYENPLYFVGPAPPKPKVAFKGVVFNAKKLKS